MKVSTATRTSKICIFNNENSSFPRLVLAFFIFAHFVTVLVLSFFVVVDKFLVSFFKFHPRIVTKHFASQTS